MSLLTLRLAGLCLLFPLAQDPATTADLHRIAVLIGDLNAEELDIRDRATRGLIEAGEPALPALKRALQDPPSDEARNRISQVVEAIDRERRRKAFKGGPPMLGLSAHVTVERGADGSVTLDVEIMNVGTTPASLVPVESTDLEFPGRGRERTSAHGKWTVRQLSGERREVLNPVLGCGFGPSRSAIALAPGESRHSRQTFQAGGESVFALPAGEFEAGFLYYCKSRDLLAGAPKDLCSDTIRFEIQDR